MGEIVRWFNQTDRLRKKVRGTVSEKMVKVQEKSNRCLEVDVWLQRHDRTETSQTDSNLFLSHFLFFLIFSRSVFFSMASHFSISPFHLSPGFSHYFPYFTSIPSLLSLIFPSLTSFLVFSSFSIPAYACRVMGEQKENYSP